jgi:hypothetical protein
MQRAYLTASAAMRFRQRTALIESKLDDATELVAVRLRTVGERHDQIGESLFKLWWKVRSCLPPLLWLALLSQSLQGQLPCENGEGLCVHEKVAWLLTSRRCVGGEPGPA